ncbi:CM1 [Scenedesmus sp. PABB004]|nr:CM1 [Scenedesmus sp. PABB004]
MRAGAAALAAAAGEAPGGAEAALSSLWAELPEPLVLHALSYLPPALQAWTAKLVCKAARERFRGATAVSLRCPELPLAAVQEAWRAVQGDGWQQRGLANARAACGDVAGLAWLRGAGCRTASVVRPAARAGHLAVLEWARGERLGLRDVCRGAAEGGQIAVVEWARSQRPPLPWDNFVCLCAARRGNLEMLRWARAQDRPAPWHWTACTAAAERGDLDVLRWLALECFLAPRAVADAAASASSSAQQQQQQQQQQQPAGGGGGARDMSASLSLANIRSSLIRQEDSIIFTLIERAQFARNAAVYEPGGVQVPAYGRDGTRLSLLEYLLRETEALHGKVRRYTSPDEHAFFPDDLPPLVLPPLEYPGVLAPAAGGININATILATYVDAILPEISAPGDDGNYGSAGTLDVLALQALSKRIHYGKFVAEAKFRARPEEYTALIRAQDGAGLMALLTDVAVERTVVERVRLKAATFGRDIHPGAAPLDGGASGGGAAALASASLDGGGFKIAPSALAAMYETVVMPLTKEVQVAYLLRRLD